MALELVVENGSIVPNANSYVSLEQVRNYALERGVVLPESDDELIPLVIGAMDYVESFGERFQGRLISPGIQPLCWPRKFVRVSGYEYPIDTIPAPIQRAVLTALVISTEHELVVNVSEPPVSREVIGPLSTSFATSSVRPWDGPSFPALDSLLEPFLGGRSLWSSIPLKAVR